jgi:hypothetical protein
VPAEVPHRPEADRTGEVLRLLRRRRREHGRTGNTAYLIYVGVLLFGVYGVPYLLGVAALSGPNTGSRTALRVAAALPTGLPTLLLAVWLLAARDGLWRGPVSPPAALVDWLLPTPLSRARLLGRSYATSLLATAPTATFVGALAAAGIAACGAGDVVRLLIGGALTGLLTGLIAAGTGLAVQRWSVPGRLTATWTAAAWLVIALGTLATVLAATGRQASWPAPVASWSGPWGWAAQPVLLVTTNPGATGGAGPAGLVGAGPGAAGTVLALLCGLAAVAAVAWVPQLPLEGLRRRARSVQQVASAVMTFDLRQARLSGRAAAADRGLPVRVPLPPWSRLAVAGRDLGHLLRFPGRVAASAAAVALAAALLGWAATAPADGRALLVLLGWVAFYLAAGQLLEPARLDADDPGRAARLAIGFGTIAVQHALVPTSVLAALALAAGAVAERLGGTTPVALLAPASITAVAAALVSAYRGPLPPGLMVGTPTPMGDTGTVQVALWYARGALLMIIGMTVLTLTWLSGPDDGLRLVPTALGVLGTLWARRLAERLAEPY